MRNKLLLTASLVTLLTVPAFAGVLDDVVGGLIGPGITVQLGPTIIPNYGAEPISLPSIVITNVGRTPITINSLDINNGGCKVSIRGTRVVKNSNYRGNFLTYAQTAHSQWCPVDPMNERTYSNLTKDQWDELNRQHWKAMHASNCFDHKPTQAEIEANDPGDGQGGRQNMAVADDKDFGNVILTVGQRVVINQDSMYSMVPGLMAAVTGNNLPAVYACPQGVDVVRVTVGTDKGSKTFEVAP